MKNKINAFYEVYCGKNQSPPQDPLKYPTVQGGGLKFSFLIQIQDRALRLVQARGTGAAATRPTLTICNI